MNSVSSFVDEAYSSRTISPITSRSFSSGGVVKVRTRAIGIRPEFGLSDYPDPPLRIGVFVLGRSTGAIHRFGCKRTVIQRRHAACVARAQIEGLAAPQAAAIPRSRDRPRGPAHTGGRAANCAYSVSIPFK